MRVYHSLASAPTKDILAIMLSKKVFRTEPDWKSLIIDANNTLDFFDIKTSFANWTIDQDVGPSTFTFYWPVAPFGGEVNLVFKFGECFEGGFHFLPHVFYNPQNLSEEDLPQGYEMYMTLGRFMDKL